MIKIPRIKKITWFVVRLLNKINRLVKSSSGLKLEHERLPVMETDVMIADNDEQLRFRRDFEETMKALNIAVELSVTAPQAFIKNVTWNEKDNFKNTVYIFENTYNFFGVGLVSYTLMLSLVKIG